MHAGEAVADLMEAYFLQRRERGLDSEHFRQRLRALGKNEDEIAEILLELDADWQKEITFDAEKKNVPWMLTSGFLTVIAFAVIAMWGSQKKLFADSSNLLWAGGMAVGFLGILKAFSILRKATVRVERRRIKYKLYK